MGRGVSYGGGQSSLGYLFGSDEPPKAAPSGATGAVVAAATTAVKESTPPPNQAPPTSAKTTPENGGVPDIAAGQLGSNPNNYHRADGQNTGNFITDALCESWTRIVWFPNDNIVSRCAPLSLFLQSVGNTGELFLTPAGEIRRMKQASIWDGAGKDNSWVFSGRAGRPGHAHVAVGVTLLVAGAVVIGQGGVRMPGELDYTDLYVKDELLYEYGFLPSSSNEHVERRFLPPV
ncbi:hypothetical protein L7F22_002949 [Adiantum nelumboides]|nr:hypothetical protein [Adiantum nelumboides]